MKKEDKMNILNLLKDIIVNAINDLKEEKKVKEKPVLNTQTEKDKILTLLRLSSIKLVNGEYNKFALLKSLVRQESSFRPKVVSWVGAVGLMQIMPNTGKMYGITKEQLLDPVINVKTGIKHLNVQIRYWQQKGCSDMEAVKLALASYNAGRGYIMKANALVKKNNQELTWENVKPYLKSGEANIKGRTCDYKQVSHYVSNIMKFYNKYIEK